MSGVPWRCLALLLPALACGEPGDADADGLSDRDEKHRGTDPFDTDTDDDWLEDGPEVHRYHTPPTAPDSDFDGYLDGDEVLMGSNPLNEYSLIYAGGWPFWRDKDSLADGSWPEGRYAPGDRFAHLVAPDQHMQPVDLYDFAGPAPTWDHILLVSSALHCDECSEVTNWLDGHRSLNVPVGPWFAYERVRDAIAWGQLGYVVVLSELDTPGSEPQADSALNRGRSLAGDHAVLVDLDHRVRDAVWASPDAAGSGVVLDARTMEVLAIGDLEDVLGAAMAIVD